MTTIKKQNPYNGKEYEVVVPEKGMNIPANAVIILENGVQKMISKGGLASLLSTGSLTYLAPELTKYDYAVAP